MLAKMFHNSLLAGLTAICVLTTIAFATPSPAKSKIATFTLENGMKVVVIPDHRAPVVTHMIWYRVGAADDPWGKSGLAHFFEHLMFKSTRTKKTGDFTRIITRLGGRHNALTSRDSTAYFQRAAKQHLQSLMELEADRMVNLQLREQEVRIERNVVREERRGSVDGSPVNSLSEQMMSALYQNHPYARPVLGWPHEIADYRLKDVVDFYKRYYAPNNAVLVVSGDVTANEVRKLAEATYGRIETRPLPAARPRPLEPESLAPRWVRLTDARIGSPLMLRYYLVPSFASANSGDAEALAILARIIGGDTTSRLYRQLVLETKIALQAGADYQSTERDSGRLALLATSSRDIRPTHLEQAMDSVVANIRSNGVTQEEVDRAKRALEVERVFDTDNQERRARQIGKAVMNGRSIADIMDEAARIDAVAAADVNRVARKYLNPAGSVTGTIVSPTLTTARSGSVKP